MNLRIVGLVLAFSGLAGWSPLFAQNSQPISGKPTTVVFVCLHGIAKSQVAAAHFNRIAKERGLPVVAISRGIAIENEIPAGVRQGLARDGLTPQAPLNLTPDEAAGAVKIFAFDEVPTESKGAAEITYWSDVPVTSKDYNAARDVIVRHAEEAAAALAAKR